MASAIRSDSESESLIAFPSSCMRFFNGSSTTTSAYNVGCDCHTSRCNLQIATACTRLDCSGGCTASQVLHQLFYRHSRPDRLGTITSDNIEMLCQSVTFIGTEREF